MTQRTIQQNKALHKLFGEIADHCVAHGIDQKVVINHFQKFETPVTPESVKETWRIIQRNMVGTESTTELTMGQVDRVYEVFNLFWSQVTKEHFPFPSSDTIKGDEAGNQTCQMDTP